MLNPYFHAYTVIVIYIIIVLLFRISDLKKKNRILQEEYEKTRLREKQLLVLIKELRKNVIANYAFNHSIDFNKDVEDAVKLAMKSSHPDNGGKPADFIRFQKLYTNIKNKRRD